MAALIAVVSHEPADPVCKGFGVPGRDHKSRHTLEDRFPGAADIGGHHGPAHGHGLDDGSREGFPRHGGQDGNVGCRQDLGNVISVAQKPHPIRDAVPAADPFTVLPGSPHR